MRTRLLAAVFGQWRLITVLRVLEASRSELERLQSGKRTGSIWHMKKEQLVEVACQELGMERDIASKEIVVTLRQKIRSHRKLRDAESQMMKILRRQWQLVDHNGWLSD